MQLLPGEETILTSDNDMVTLTNQRVQYAQKEWATSSTTILFLENISSIEKRHKGERLFLLLPGLFIVYTLYKSGDYMDMTTFYFAMGFTAFFLAAWWFNREKVIVIKSTGGTPIKFVIEKMSDEKADDFMRQVMLARSNRLQATR